MNKTVIITVIVDDVSYTQIEELEDTIREAIEVYTNKRVTINLQDDRLVSNQVR